MHSRRLVNITALAALVFLSVPSVAGAASLETAKPASTGSYQLVKPANQPLDEAIAAQSASNSGGTTNRIDPAPIPSWQDNRRVVVYFRTAEKMRTQHNILTAPIRRSTQYPDRSGAAGSATNREYFATFQLRNCNASGCGPVQKSQEVRTLVDFRTYGSQTYGVVTSYCVGITLCPDWVNTAV